VTLRGGGGCTPELMVSPAGSDVQGRVLGLVGERSFPLSMTGAGSRDSEAQHLAVPPAPGGGGQGREELTAGRAP
jgi:hypothetical protein